MSLSDEKILELHDLLDRLVEKNISQDQRRKLEQWLAESEEVRKIYVSFMDMNASLCHYAQETLGDADQDGEDDSRLTSRIVEFGRALLPVAALFLFGGYIFFSYQNSPSLSPSADKMIPMGSSDEAESLAYAIIDQEPVAVLTKAVGLQWLENVGDTLEVGGSIYSGKWETKRGIAQVEFMQGATVIFEGAVEVEFLNSNAAVLIQGKMRAHVPKVAVGFSVDLPMGKVIDLGTDFGLHTYGDGSAEVFVYRGKVRYEGLDSFGNEVIRELVGNEALFLDARGIASSIDMPTGSYLGSSDLATRSMEQAQRRRSAWMELSKRLSTNPGTLLYYAFDNHDAWSRTLRDETNQRDGNGNGAVIGCKWTEGRWPGKGALKFSQKNDRVCLNLPKPLSSATLSAWVRIDRISEMVAPIMFSRPHLSGAIGWSLNRKGELVLEINAPSGVERYASPVALTRDRMGKWVHLATSFDAQSKWVNHFLNGRSFSRERVGFARSVSLKKGLLGHTQAFRGYNPNIALDGCIDEFAIFDSAWTEEEIRELFEIGSPTDVDSTPNALFP